MSVRVRGPAGQATVGLEAGMTVAAFCQAVEQRTGVLASQQELRGGFPPRLLQLPADMEQATVASLGIQPGDSITVTRAAGAAPAARPAAAVPAPPSVDGGSAYSLQGMSEDEQLARAIAASLGQDVPGPNSAAAAAAPAAAAGPAAGRAPPAQTQQPAPSAGTSSSSSAVWAPLPDGTGVVRRKMEDDNSCLFSAVGYVSFHDRRRVPQLRGMIADAVLQDPFEWNEAVLQKEPPAYAAWILQPNTWGGAIELSILAQRLGREIAAFDIQTQRADVYGQGQGYTERVLLIYDGLHYDALAVAAFQGAPEGTDVTAIPSSGPITDAVMQAAAELVAHAHAARQFTDTANFTLRCGVCKQGLRGEKEALAHAKATGHANFTEY